MSMMIRKKKRRRPNRRLNPRPFILIGVVLAIVAAVLLIVLLKGREESAERGSIMFSVTGKSAVIIRDEHTYFASEHTKTDFWAEEGSRVSSGDKLATVYKLGYSDEIMQSLLNSREEVYAAQMERIGATKDTRLDELNDSIRSLKIRISDCVMKGSGEDLETLYRQLDRLLKERMEYLRGKVQETEVLRALYASVEDKEALLAAWTEDVYSGHNGIVSFYFDGYEQAMNAEKINMISADLVKRALKDSGAANWTTDDKTRVCRVVNDGHWYVAFVTKGDDLTRVAEGMEYEVTVEGYGAFKGTALEPVISGSEIVNVIEINGYLGGLMEVRTVKVDVSASAAGIKVKSKAIRVEKGETYIELVTGGSRRPVKVDVLASDGKYAIIRPHDSEESLSEGVRYWNRKR